MELASSHYNLHDIHLLLCIQYLTPDDGQKTCPKHVEFYSKNKFDKLRASRWFYYKNCHDARSSECQECRGYFNLNKIVRKKACISLVILAYMCHDALFRECKV